MRTEKSLFGCLILILRTESRIIFIYDAKRDSEFINEGIFKNMSKGYFLTVVERLCKKYIVKR